MECQESNELYSREIEPDIRAKDSDQFSLVDLQSKQARTVQLR